MSKEQQYLNTINKLLIDANDSPDDMLALGKALLQGVASIILHLPKDFQQEAIDDASPTIQFYVDHLKERYGV